MRAATSCTPIRSTSPSSAWPWERWVATPTSPLPTAPSSRSTCVTSDNTLSPKRQLREPRRRFGLRRNHRDRWCLLHAEAERHGSKPAEAPIHASVAKWVAQTETVAKSKWLPEPVVESERRHARAETVTIGIVEAVAERVEAETNRIVEAVPERVVEAVAERIVETVAERVVKTIAEWVIEIGSEWVVEIRAKRIVEADAKRIVEAV